MSACFGDTSYFIALLSPRDAFHQQALRLAREQRGLMVTTPWVLTELADGFCERTDAREKVAAFIHLLERQELVAIEPADDEWFAKGLELFEGRLDKEWSLTDCISFVVMQARGMSEALTADHHFEQAGFVALLKEGTT